MNPRSPAEGQKSERCYESLRSSVDPRDHALAQIAEDMADIQAKTDQMRRVLMGDPDFRQPGLVDFVNGHHKRIKLLERVMIWGTGALAALGLFWDSIKQKLL